MNCWHSTYALCFLGAIISMHAAALANEPVFKQVPEHPPSVIEQSIEAEEPVKNRVPMVEKPTSVDECLFVTYLRAPKIDATGEFTHKDPAAATIVGLSLERYVIGGMDKGFKSK